MPEVKLPATPNEDTICFSVKFKTDERPAATPKVPQTAVG